MRCALDTNVLAYAEGLGEAEKCLAARALVVALPTAETILPAQTLGELFRVLTGKKGESPLQAKQAVLSWADAFEVADSSYGAFVSAMDLASDHGLQIWDSLIFSVAAEANCRLLISEDMQDGFTWRGLTVVNPFADPPSKLLEALLG